MWRRISLMIIRRINEGTLVGCGMGERVMLGVGERLTRGGGMGSYARGREESSRQGTGRYES